ncbi:hypothetical protein RHMOL_Rhmol10G0176500 [Rhododendron molle]|uniref:Uncharacterized protein n=1 Tax=Rhododendron molle TaxID=49168 RepID=A0ACC0M3D1_RHOML|nr:hypothetical protein RHMOL_Rhmol10G0176500 [Rhododendron molle]
MRLCHFSFTNIRRNRAPMARIAPTYITPFQLRPHGFLSNQSLSPIILSFRSHNKNGRYQKICCQTDPNPTDSSSSSSTEKLIEEPGLANVETTQAAGSSIDARIPEYPSKSINRQIALVSTLAAVGLFLSTRLDLGVSLKDLTAVALPYEEAMSNGKPTVVEFYADWCEVCRELALDVYKVEQIHSTFVRTRFRNSKNSFFRDRVNFVMLNVDNTKWEQELDEFGVEGIPHFAFLDKKGNEEGNVVGRLPRQYFLENVDALARGEASIPHARVVGQFSSAEARKVHQVVDPRSHG